MVKVVWDNLLPQEQTGIEKWDTWFEAVGLTKEWNVVKEQFPNDIQKQLAWAKILELNRLATLERKI